MKQFKHSLLIAGIFIFISLPSLFGQDGTITFSEYCPAGFSKTWNININAYANVRITYTTDITLNSDQLIILNNITTPPDLFISGYQSGSFMTYDDGRYPVICFEANTSGYKTFIIQYSADYSQGNLQDLNVLGNALISGTSTVNGASTVMGNTYLNGNALISGTSTVNGASSVMGNTYLNGNVGIGTPNPSLALDIERNYDYQLRLGNASGYGYNIGRNSTTGIFTFYGDQSGNNGYSFGGINGTRMIIGTNGNVGIGTSLPTQKLCVYDGRIAIKDAGATTSDEGYKGNLMITKSAASGQYINLTRQSNIAWSIGTVYNSSTFAIGAGKSSDAAFTAPFFNIDPSGKVGIGTTTPDELLTVKGIIHAQEVKIDMSGALVPDYVFDDNYKLMPLHEVEQYVKTNSHLPEIPSASEITKNGLSIGEMQNKLLQKIEELTLYVIEQQKEINMLKQAQK